MIQLLISSRQNALCKQVRALHSSKGRREQKLFLAEGRNAVEAALQSGWPINRVLCAPDTSEKWRADLPSQIPLQEVTMEILEYLSDAQTSTEVLALCEFPALCHELAFENLWMVLDGVSDPGNVGTLIRAADAANAGGVILTSSSADAFSPKAVRASAGSIFHLSPLGLKDSSPRAVSDLLAGRSTPIIIADASGEISCFDFNWPQRCALVLGHETRGVSPEFQNAATARVKIPIYGKAESLNVATAGAVLLYAWRNFNHREGRKACEEN